MAFDKPEEIMSQFVLFEFLIKTIFSASGKSTQKSRFKGSILLWYDDSHLPIGQEHIDQCQELSEVFHFSS